MSNERFDRLLKKNLESVRPDYQPSAWNRFSKRLPAVGFWPWVQTYGGWAMCGMMLAGWLTTIYTLRENQELIRQLNASPALKMVAAERVAKQVDRDDSTPKNSTVNRIDTVYIIKKTIVENRFSGGDPSLKLNEYELAGKRIQAQENAEKNDRQAAFTHYEDDDEIKQDDLSQQNANLSKSAEIGKTDSSSILSTAAQPTVVDTVIKTPSAIALAAADSLATFETLKYVSHVARRDSLLLLQTENQQALRPKRPPFRFSSLQPRLGIESLFSLHSYGIGPVAELFPTENLGISIGIQASTLEAENHKALRDYNSATGKLFLVQYRSYLPSRFDRIEDISIKTSVVSIPLSLKYYIPLKHKISLFVHTGTSLDINAYQQVDFESYINRSKRRNTFETDAKPNFFHNFMFGTGLQYKQSRILAQLSPYFVYDFRNIVNTPSGSNLGVRASLWVNLFK